MAICFCSSSGTHHVNGLQLLSSNPSSPSSASSSFWPPWPFSVISNQQNSDKMTQEQRELIKATRTPSPSKILVQAIQNSMKEGISSTQHLLSQSTKHLPPAGPPIILLSLVPSSTLVATYARRLGLATVGCTILSWSHNELTKKRKLGEGGCREAAAISNSVNVRSSLILLQHNN